MARGVLGSVINFFFGRSPDKRGGRVLAWGVGVFVLVFLFFWGMNVWFPSIGSGRGLIAWFFVPILVPLLAAIFSPTILGVRKGTVTPVVSFAAAFRWVRRMWRAIFGVILLFAAAVALLAEFLAKPVR